jgi:hypothetical protein
MKHIATVALVLNLAVAGIYAQQKPLKMTFSGTAEPGTINLKPRTSNAEDDFSRNGSLGPFTFCDLQAETASPPPSSTCSGSNR